MTYQSEVLADSPVAYWKFDETSTTAPTAADAAGGSAWAFGSGVVGGQAAVVADGGTSVHGDGANPIASLGSVPTGINGSNTTLEAWVKLPAGNVQGSFVKVGSSSNGWGMGVGGTQWDNPGRTLVLLSETVAWHPTTYTFPAGAGTYHVMVVRGAGGAVTAYVNGTSVWSGTLSSPVTASGLMGVGGYAGRSFGLSATINIDNAAAYASALSSTRVTAHYNSGSGDNAAITADSPSWWLKLDEIATAAGAYDSSGNSRLLNYGPTPPNVGQASLLGDSTGKSVTITSTAMYLTLPSASWMDTTAGLTVEARIKPNAGVLAAGGFIASRWGGGAGQNMWLFGVTSTGKLSATVVTGGTNRAITGTTTLVADTVYTASLRWTSGGNVELFLNGVSDATPVSAPGSIAVPAMPIEVGRAALTGGSGLTWGGGIDELSVSPSALSGTRLTARHAAAINSGTTPQSFTGSPASLTVAAPAGSFVAGTKVPQAYTGTPASVTVSAPAGAFMAGTAIPAAFTGTPVALTVNAPVGAFVAGTKVAADFTGTPVELTVEAPAGDVATSTPAAQNFTGTPASVTVTAPTGGYLLESGAAEDVTYAVEDAASPVALTIGAAEDLTLTLCDAADPIQFQIEQLDAIAEAWAEAYADLSVALDPDTNRPQYRLKVVDRAGDVVCELTDAQIGTATRSLNGRGGLDFTLGKNDAQLANVTQFSEVQLWRGAHLVPGGWFTVTDPRTNEGDDSFDVQCAGLTYYFERVFIGKERPELILNGSFEQGSRYWGFSYSPGSNAETPPKWEIISDAREGGNALRIFADDKVEKVERVVESAAVFVPNEATFLSGGEAAIRAQVADIPNGTHITVEGHTADSDGGTGHALSLARANAAAAVIHAYKPTLVITTVGKGETEPVDPRHTEAAYRKNRRVVILANIVQTKEGHRQFGGQVFTYVNNDDEALEIDIQVEARVDEFEAPSKDGRLLYADVRAASAPNKPLNDGETRVDEYTPVGKWLGQEATVKVPAGGQPYRVNVRLFPTAGSTTFDLVSAKPNFKLSYKQTDPRHVIGGLVEHAQDPAFDKGDLNIQPFGPLSGFKIDGGPWEWKAHKPVMEAISDVVSSLNGPDANISVTPRRRWLVIHPKQGRDNGIILAAGDCAGDARILGYSAGIDGDLVASTAIVRSSRSGGGSTEVYSRTSRTDGLVLERLYDSEQDTPSATLLEQARTAVKYGHSDVVTQVSMHPDDTTLLMERVTIGDIITVAVKDGRVDVNARYRITQIQLDPGADQLTYTLALEG